MMHLIAPGRRTHLKAALLAAAAVLALSAPSAQAQTTHYSCTWNQGFDLSGGAFNVLSAGGTYVGDWDSNGTCAGAPNVFATIDEPVADTGTWTGYGVAATAGPVCGPAVSYGVNHILNGTATISLFSGATSDNFTVPYTLTEAGGSVVFKSQGAKSADYPGETVVVTGTGATNGFDACPNTKFQWTGTLDITTSG